MNLRSISSVLVNKLMGLLMAQIVINLTLISKIQILITLIIKTVKMKE